MAHRYWHGTGQHMQRVVYSVCGPCSTLCPCVISRRLSLPDHLLTEPRTQTGSMYPAHMLGVASGSSRINKNRRRSRHKMKYALSPLNFAMQHPPASECADQQPLVLQPVFSEEDLASIASRTSKRATAGLQGCHSEAPAWRAAAVRLGSCNTA
jgi:hypothetical protein